MLLSTPEMAVVIYKHAFMLATALLLSTGPLLWCIHDHVATLPIGLYLHAASC